MGWNRDQKKTPCMYSQLAFNTGVKNTKWEEDNAFNEWCWENWISTS
jgi:hypothetical protein